jgi:hypothetical protein
MEVLHRTRSLRKRGCTLYFSYLWVLTLYYDFLNGFYSDIGRFNPFLRDLGPFFRPDLGGMLGDGYQLQAYINQRFLNPWRGFRTGLCF